MEYTPEDEATSSAGQILCCECGTLINPNPSNMCVGCLRTQIDITEGIPKQVHLLMCKKCKRYLQPPNQWLLCALESRELLSLCLKRLKGLNRTRLVDAAFVWTEPHSQQLKVKVTVQKEVLSGAVLQQVFVIDFCINTQMCDDCHRSEAKDFWKAVVQVRQKVQHKKTFYYLEQLILKHKAHSSCHGIKPIHGGLDFFFAKKDDARKFCDFLATVVPCRTVTSQQLISHDVRNNVYNYKYTFSVELAPICKHDVVCLPRTVARSLGNIGQICICNRVTNVIHLIDPSTLQMAEVTSTAYWKAPFTSISTQKYLSEFTIMDIEFIRDSEKPIVIGQGHLSMKHVLSDCWVVRTDQLGVSEDQIHCRTHLGHLLKPGDTALGFNLANANINHAEFEKLKVDNIPDVVLVKKVFGEKGLRMRRRKWKLKHLEEDLKAETGSSNRDYNDFLEDLEEDVGLRQHVNIYADSSKLAIDTDDQDDDDIPKITLQEMMDDLTLEDAEMADLTE